MKNKKTVFLVCFALLAGVCASIFHNKAVSLSAEPDQTVEVSNLTEFKNIANNLGYKYVLTSDIDCNGENIKFSDFYGVIDGNGHTISGVDFRTSTKYLRYLFTNNHGKIINTTFSGIGAVESNYGTIESCTINVDRYFNKNDTCAFSGVVSKTNYSLIKNCNANVTLTSYYVSFSLKQLGGFVDFNDGGTISNCSISGELTFTIDCSGGYSASENTLYIGGLVAENANGGAITKCLSDIDISVSNYNAGFEGYVGGVACWNSSDVSFSSYSGDIDILYDYRSFVPFDHEYGMRIGGISGVNYPEGMVFNCCSSGSYYIENVAGIIGGISCYSNEPIVNCFSKAALSSTKPASLLYGICNNLLENSNNLLCVGDNYLSENVTTTEEEIAISSISGENYQSSRAKNNYNTSIWDFDYLVDSLPQLNILSISKNYEEGGLYFAYECGEGVCDESPYSPNTVINGAGNHHLIVTFGDYSFHSLATLDAIINGVANNQTYYGSVSPNVANGDLYINGEQCVNGNPITMPGTYNLSARGVNNYQKNIAFNLEPNISGVANDGNYDSSVIPVVSGGTLTLDGNTYTSGTEIVEPGNHTLVINGVNDYSKTITFTVNLIDSGIKNGDTFIDSASYTYSGGSVTLDGNAYISGATISEIGNHAIVVNGSSGFNKTINFTIEPSITGLEAGHIYYSAITPIINGGTITLDGNAYTSGTEISDIGNHVLSITGSNGYIKTINFEIRAINYQIETDDYSWSIYFPNIHPGTVVTIDGVAINASSYTETMIGNHTLRIVNEPGCDETINFTIESNINLIEGNTYLDSTLVETNKAELLLDGNAYVSGTNITKIGNHTMRVIGTNGYTKDIHFTIAPTISNVADGGSYSSPVTPIISGGNITLDGKAFISGTSITDPGNHTLLITGVNGWSKTINFSVNLTDSGINEGDVFIDTASYTYSGGTVTLDGQAYASGTNITEIGNHTIVVNGSTGFNKTIHFVIEPSISGVASGSSYESSVTPVISGGAITLDNQTYFSGTPITTPGDHTLVITGVNGYTKTITFSIGLVDSGIENNAVYYDPVSYTYSGGSVTLDGQAYVSGTPITEIGRHTIVVTGSNGFEKVISFEIKAVEYNIESTDETWSIDFSNLHPDTVVTIDGQTITESYEETRVGNHTLVITNENGYEQTVEFTVKENVNFTDGEVINNPLVIQDIEADVYVDGVKVNPGYRIDQNGTHEIKIVGSNGYVSTYHITYNNPNYGYALFMIAPITISLGLVIFVFIKRRRML